MLERTAGCLETGSLRRLLPGCKKSVRSRRALHSAFWNHGAADIELSPLWSALVRGTDHIAQYCETRRQRNVTGGGGAAVLDFLYPAGTLSFLRQYSSWTTDRRDGRKAVFCPGKLGQRLYTSYSKDTSQSGECSKQSETTSHKSNVGPSPEFFGLTKLDDYNAAWEHFSALNEEQQPTHRSRLILYLGRSNRYVDAERIITAFELADMTIQSSDIFLPILRAYIRVGNNAAAIALHRNALDTIGTLDGSGRLLGHLIEQASWSDAFNTWVNIQDFQNRNPSINSNIFAQVEGMPWFVKRSVDLVHFVRTLSEASPSSWTGPGTQSEFTTFTLELVRRAIFSQYSTEYMLERLLDALQDWGEADTSFYEALIHFFSDLRKSHLVVKVYRKARTLPNVTFTRPMLHHVLITFCRSHSVNGMQEVLDDFFRLYKGPSRTAYRMCMQEFASQGDAETVRALFDQFIASRMNKGRQSSLEARDFESLLHVHAKRGELSETVEFFNQMTDVYGTEANVTTWNILINAHGKVRDVDGAFAVFQRMLALEKLRPDHYTFGTLMAIVVASGDIDRTIDLYHLAEKLNIEKSCAMVNCVVLAYVQEGRLRQARKLCEESLSMNLVGNKTYMWNQLLVAHAMRIEISQVHWLLKRMSSAGIDYDQATYAALMQAFVMTKRPDKAHSVMSTVMRRVGIMPTAFHYAIIMGGYIAIRDPRKAILLYREMVDRGIQTTASTRLLLTKASVKEDDRASQRGTMNGSEQSALKIFGEMIDSLHTQDATGAFQKGTHGHARDILNPTMMYNYIIFILAQQKEHQTVHELYSRYLTLLPESQRDCPPIEIISALMVSKLGSDDFEGVQACWDMAVTRAKKDGSRPQILEELVPKIRESSDQKITTLHRLDLATILPTYMNSLAKQMKAEELIKIVNKLEADGFLLSNRNWNHYIRLLSTMFRFKRAFTLCETKLMDGWFGWARTRWHLPMKNKLSLHIRRTQKDPLTLRPNTHTMLDLAAAYIKLEKLAAQSPSTRRLLDDIERTCPRVIEAILSVDLIRDPLSERKLEGDDM